MTSSKKFLEMDRQTTKREIECLVNGESVGKKVIEELTYRDLYKNMENFWSVLFMTGNPPSFTAQIAAQMTDLQNFPCKIH